MYVEKTINENSNLIHHQILFIININYKNNYNIIQNNNHCHNLKS